MLMIFDSNDLTTASFVMWRIDARYSENSPIVFSELEVSAPVKNAMIRRLKARGYEITVKEITRGNTVNETLFCCSSIKK